ncbi:MAG: hypothetical protein JW991_03835 [Candidatus Pacebacteria bacterium]|nr:hypothetical protein [Candidatus Paceibacterota bacterium]
MKNVFKTHQLYIATYLLATGNVPLLCLEKISPKKVLFVFENTLLCQKLINEYWDDVALINPKKLFSCLNELKDRLFAERRETL